MKISEQLKKRRIELQLSQEYVAEKAGISRRTLAYYESGDRTPNAENLLALCNIYDLDANDLLVGDLKAAEKTNYDNIDSDVLARIDEYLKIHKIRRDTYKRIILFACILITFFSMLVCGIATTLKIILMNVEGYSFGEATARFWTDFFNTMIDFVNNESVKGLPLVSLFVCSFFVLGWGIYFLVKYLRRKRTRRFK